MPGETATKNLNVFILGLAFLGLFTAFNTMGNIQQTILDSAVNEDLDEESGYVEGFSATGFYSSAIIYAVFAVFSWFAPSVMVVLGLKVTMFLGAVTYPVLVASFFYLNDYLYYSASALLGLGAAILWTAQGTFLTANSTKETMSRNAGVFWAMLQSNLLVGNTIAYYQFQGLSSIDKDTRVTTVGIFFACALAGCVIFLFLLPAHDDRGRNICATFWILPDKSSEEAHDSPLQALKKSLKLFVTLDMLMLCVYFYYTGMLLSFWSVVYGTSLSRTKSFDDPSGMVGLHGIFVGVGEILGGAIFGIFGSWTNKVGRWPVAVLGLVTIIGAGILILLNIPNDALLSIDGTTDVSVFDPPNQIIALACSFLIGFGDAAANTQVTSILGGVYKDNAGPAFSILKSVQSAASAIALAYTDKLELYIQIPMLMAMGVIGTVFFSYVDIRTGKREALSLKERGMELEEMEGAKRPKPTEVQEAPTSKL